MNRARRKKPWYRRAWVIVAGAVLVLLLAAVAVLGPAGLAIVQTRPVEGAVEIGGGATVTPGDGWSARPLVAGLPPSPVGDWRRLVEGDGWRLYAPDRVMEVDLEVAPGASDPVDLVGSADPANVERRETLTETLASGAVVRHVSSENEFVAVVEGVGGEPIAMRARVPEGTSIETYRPTLSALLESLSSAIRS